MKKVLTWLVVFLMLSTFFSGCEEKVSFESPITSENYKEKLNVTDYGIVADSFDSAKANTKALNKLISSCKEGAQIYFPKNTYYFESQNGAIQLRNKKALMLSGDDALIVNTSFDPTEEVTPLNYNKSMTVGIENCHNIRIEGLNFDYYRYTQICGKVVEKKNGYTVIEIDPLFVSGEDKPEITGKEIVSTINVLDENGAVLEDHYAENKFDCYLDGNKFYVSGDFGRTGSDILARFNLSTAPVFYASKTSNLTINNIKSYSSPAALFLMSGEGNENFNFSNITVKPPENAIWRWGCNCDGIFLNCMRGEVNINNCTFVGMGDDSLNVHSTAATVKSIDGNKVKLNYGYNDLPVNNTWARENDILVFYKKDFSISAEAKVIKHKSKTLTLEITKGYISVGDIVENVSLSPKVTVENVTVDGGRARAFLLQTDNVKIKNCNISNLGLAGIIISPDINKWYEMGPAENIEISGCNFKNLCTMKNNSCKGAIFSASSHDGHKTNVMIHKNIVITHNTFDIIHGPIISLTSVDGATIKNNVYSNICLPPETENCKNVIIE